MTRLDQFDKVEWFDLCRKMKPGLTEAEYDVMWERFQAAKAEHEARKRLN